MPLEYWPVTSVILFLRHRNTKSSYASKLKASQHVTCQASYGRSQTEQQLLSIDFIPIRRSCQDQQTPRNCKHIQFLLLISSCFVVLC